MIHPQDTTPANPAQGVSDQMIEAATKELLAHGEFSSIPGNNEPNARIAARAALTAAIGVGGQAVDSSTSPAPVQEAVAKVRRVERQPLRFDDDPLYQELSASPTPQASGVSEAMVEAALDAYCKKFPIGVEPHRDGMRAALEAVIPATPAVCPECAGTGYKDKGGARAAIQRTPCSRGCKPPSAVAPTGGEWRWVPVEPTKAMIEAGFPCFVAPTDYSARKAWSAMLAASPAKEERS